MACTEYNEAYYSFVFSLEEMELGTKIMAELG